MAERATINVKLLTSTHATVGFLGFAGPGANREGLQEALEEGVGGQRHWIEMPTNYRTQRRP